MKSIDEHPTPKQPRQPWVPPTMNPVGTVGDVLQSGGGKASFSTGDPGEPRKVPSLE